MFIFDIFKIDKKMNINRNMIVKFLKQNTIILEIILFDKKNAKRTISSNFYKTYYVMEMVRFGTINKLKNIIKTIKLEYYVWVINKLCLFKY